LHIVWQMRQKLCRPPFHTENPKNNKFFILLSHICQTIKSDQQDENVRVGESEWKCYKPSPTQQGTENMKNVVLYICSAKLRNLGLFMAYWVLLMIMK
jgi:hypothetical protein